MNALEQTAPGPPHSQSYGLNRFYTTQRTTLTVVPIVVQL